MHGLVAFPHHKYFGTCMIVTWSWRVKFKSRSAREWRRKINFVTTVTVSQNTGGKFPKDAWMMSLDVAFVQMPQLPGSERVPPTNLLVVYLYGKNGSKFSSEKIQDHIPPFFERSNVFRSWTSNIVPCTGKGIVCYLKLKSRRKNPRKCRASSGLGATEKKSHENSDVAYSTNKWKKEGQICLNIY